LADKVRIGVIDIYPIFREAIVRAVTRAEDLVVVAEGESAEDAIRIARRCDVLLIESAVPNSLKAAKAVLENTPKAKVLFLAAIEDDEHASQALHLGVHGYLLKEITGSELVTALKAAHSGMRQITPDLAWRLVRQSRAAAPVIRPSSQVLTVREQEVLNHVSEGLTTKQVASSLGLSISSVKRYKTKMFRKLHVRNRLQAFARNQS
jgi:two-component system, NarL family, nitrate/nitrite response regulator NarL